MSGYDPFADQNAGEEAPPVPEAPSATDPKQAKKLRDRKKQELQEAKDFWGRVLADPIGRRECARILQFAHTFEVRFKGSPVGFPDPFATWFEAGQQEVGDRLSKHWMRIAREGWLKMMDEHFAGGGDG